MGVDNLLAVESVQAPDPDDGLGADAPIAAAAVGPGYANRILALGAAAVVAVTGTGTYLAFRSESGKPVKTGYSIAMLEPDPGARWQLPVEDLAPDLKCRSSTSTDPVQATGTCTIQDSVVLPETVVVAVQRGDRTMLAGLNRADGSVRWRRPVLSGSRYDCLAARGKLWCLTTPQTYPVSVTTGAGGLPTKGEQTVPPGQGGYESAVLEQIMPKTGASSNGARLPGSTMTAQFGGVGEDGVYVVAGASGSDATVLRYSDGGRQQWSAPVTSTSVISPVVGSGVAPAVQVVERDGKSYVSAVQVGNGQAVFDRRSGRPVRSGAGQIVTLVGAVLVTKLQGGSLAVGGTAIGGNLIARLVANGHSDGEPIITGYEADPNGLPYPQGPYTIRSPRAPKAAMKTMLVGESPVAYCSAVVIGHGLRSLSGYDARTGRRLWARGFDEGSSLEIRCDGSKVLISDGVQVTAFDTATGDDTWSVLLPGSTRLTGGGPGDPATALLAGPGELDFGSSTPTVALVQ